MTWKGKRVWITGHTGFKGSLLSHWLLESGAEVFGYALAPQTSPDLYSVLNLESRMRSHIADIRNAEEVRRDLETCRPEVVFHLAAQPLVREVVEEPAATFGTNVQGSVHVMDAMRRVPSVRACVMVTTDKCYENAGARAAFEKETDRLGGNDPYSASKAAAELAIASYRRCYFGGAGSARIASARAGNVIGGGDWSCVQAAAPDCTAGSREANRSCCVTPGQRGRGSTFSNRCAVISSWRKSCWGRTETGSRPREILVRMKEEDCAGSVDRRTGGELLGRWTSGCGGRPERVS